MIRGGKTMPRSFMMTSNNVKAQNVNMANTSEMSRNKNPSFMSGRTGSPFDMQENNRQLKSNSPTMENSLFLTNESSIYGPPVQITRNNKGYSQYLANKQN
jgi:hypothetical protein